MRIAGFLIGERKCVLDHDTARRFDRHPDFLGCFVFRGFRYAATSAGPNSNSDANHNLNANCGRVAQEKPTGNYNIQQTVEFSFTETAVIRWESEQLQSPFDNLNSGVRLFDYTSANMRSINHRGDSVRQIDPSATSVMAEIRTDVSRLRIEQNGRYDFPRVVPEQIRIFGTTACLQILLNPASFTPAT